MTNLITNNEFNFFRLFGFEKDEVKHSLFISELISPVGMHFQGTKFLKLFIETLYAEKVIDENFSFEIESAQIEVEKSVGILGRIDILLCDSKKNYIVIENKIDAALGEAQLGRYLTFVQNNAVSYRILLLTPEGKPPKEGDIGLNMPDDKIKKVCFSDFVCISYKHTILKWLNNCLALVSDSDNFKHSISQYISILNREVLCLEEDAFSSLSKNEILKTFIDELLKQIDKNISFPQEALDNYMDTNKKGQRISIHLPNVKIQDFRFEIEILNNLYFGLKSTESMQLTSSQEKALKELDYKLFNDGFVAWKYPHALRSARLNFRHLNLNTAHLTEKDYCIRVVANLVYIIKEEIERLKSIFNSN